MEKQFNFHTLPDFSLNASEANIFVHGYSAGHSASDREKLIGSIPESLNHLTNIFAFWPSSHFTRFNRKSRRILNGSTGVNLAVGAAVALVDRITHFYLIRSRAERMGELLPKQLNDYLYRNHPSIDTINLIGHSLGGRLVISTLKNLANKSEHSLSINDVLLMAAAVEVKPTEAQRMRSFVKGRLINAYSKEDRILHMNLDERSLGRNEVEHFDNIRIPNFGHSDYWTDLPEVLACTHFKSPKSPLSQHDVVVRTTQTPLAEDPPEAQTMTFELSTPGDIYQKINDELTRIVDSLNSESNDATLNQAQIEARTLLIQHQTELQTQLVELEKNAEWDTFTIAFYGETGAGKSTIIETLRILLQEPSKLASQQAFRDLKSKHCLSEEGLQILQHAIENADAQLIELVQQLNTVRQLHEQLHSDTLNTINRLQAAVAERKQTASLWQKFLNLFRKTPEEAQLARALQHLPQIAIARESATAPLLTQQVDTEKRKRALEQQFQESESHLAELRTLADGEIIGDGRPDFTRRTQRYDLELDGQSFALLDVPGIEGNEGLIHSEIAQAVQTAHAVFYVTNQAAPPQTGDEQRKGTLEKIKAHLGAQTEVWTIFNKKITNPKQSLRGRALTSADEDTSLSVLDEKMREQLGKHYREVYSLTALPAFLASTDHFAPNSQNATRRNKILADFDPEELLEKSRLRSFLQFLSDQLLSGYKAKITRSNFHKSKVALDQTAKTIGHIQGRFSKLSEKLSGDGRSAQSQLSQCFNALKQRLESSGEMLIDNFASNVRNKMYALIEDDVNNDYFKGALRDKIDAQQDRFSKEIPTTMSKEVARFQKDAEDILKRFEEHANELIAIYGKFDSTRFKGKFGFKIKIDNGIKVAGLLGGLLGIVLAPFTGGASLWVLGASAISAVVAIGKAVAGYFSTDYKKSQQRKATEDSLLSVTKQLRVSLNDGLKSTFPEMQQKIIQLGQAIAAPAQQTDALVQLLGQSANQLKTLSRQINNAGNL